MKLSLIITLSLLFMGCFNSCNKIDYPNIPVEGVDTTLYPGLWSEYTLPSFGENTNTERNILIEYFTGHFCSYCPNAAEVAKNLENSLPGRVFMSSIHMGPGGNVALQIPTPSFPRDFRTTEGLELSIVFKDFGFGTNPSGSINRIPQEGGTNFMLDYGEWTDHVTANLETPLKVNLQAKSNFYEETNGVFLHVESHFLASLEGEYGIVVYVNQNKIIAPQTTLTGTDYEYEHHNVHLGNIFGETWGRTIVSESVVSGTKIYSDFSYKIPDGLTNEDVHFQIFVYNKSTYEILQVIEHEF